MAKIKGTKNQDLLRGTKGKDSILGLAGDDELKAGAGDDLLDGGAGGDALDGGKGKDTASYKSATERIVIAETGATSEGAAGDTLIKIENIRGSAFNDFIFGDGANNKINGGGGHDELHGGDGKNLLIGGGGFDIFYGGNGADRFVGGSGYDVVYYTKFAEGLEINLETGVAKGAAAGDTYKGIEVIYGTEFADILIGDKGTNSLWGYGDDDRIVGGKGNDQLAGDAGADKLTGGKGDDTLYPGSDQDADVLDGGAGDDWVDYYNSSTGVSVDLSLNTSDFGAAGDTYKNIENVRGSFFEDTLRPWEGGRASGEGGNDIVIDSTGTEILRGGEGEDTLTDDFLALTEDGLRDIFVLEADNGLDTIYGFGQNEDLFWLAEEFFDGLLHDPDGHLADGRLINGTDPVATAGYAQLIFETDSKVLWFDPDGTGLTTPQQVAMIVGFNGTLDRDDFVVVPNL